MIWFDSAGLTRVLLTAVNVQMKTPIPEKEHKNGVEVDIEVVLSYI